MFTLSGLQEFCSSKDVLNKPAIAFNMLNTIYSKFDELVESHGLFKLHSDYQGYTIFADPNLMVHS
jgi:hypothetical protein